jgi:hypothetical protein
MCGGWMSVGMDSCEGGCEKGFSHQDHMIATLAISDENGSAGASPSTNPVAIF